jgi:chorismate mutase
MDDQIEELETLQKQILEAKEELRVLVAKRIECLDFFNELKYRESNLRRKYEALGLSYE